MDIRRVALIYDDTNRPETTGTYCRRALEAIIAVEHFRPSDFDRIPRTKFDLYLAIDDGLNYSIPDDLRPAAFWAIDTHLDFTRCLEKARRSDLVFAAQRDGVERLTAEGLTAVTWLPLACDPDIHRKFEVEKVHDVAFVGHVFPGPRAELLALLRRRYRNVFVGNAYFEEMARIYSSARLVFNRSVRNDVNMRVFEALSSGSLLLTNDLRDNGQAEWFRDGVHLVTYQDADEMLDKTAYYLAHDALRERIAAAGLHEVQARHTYRHRMEAVLTAASALTPVHVAPRFEVVDAPLDPAYYEFERPELLELIPRSARRVLDVGCAAGRLGESLKRRQPARVVGIESTPAAAQRAHSRLDQVIQGDAEFQEPGTDDPSFDCIVCGDVLEHMRDPERFLRRARSWLVSEGVVVASIPNVRHHSVVSSLLEGNWTYEAAGLLDETHLNFFTRRDMLDLFGRAGFRVDGLRAVPGPGYEEWRERGRPGEVKAGRLHIADMPPEEAEEFYIYQYLLTASLASHSDEDAGIAPQVPARAPGAQGRERDKAQRGAPPHNPLRLIPASPSRSKGPMRFTQNFLADFDQFDFHGPPFAFVRFGDGERSICRGLPLVNCDGWQYDGRASQFAADLNAALTYSAPDYYLGISDGCCDRESRDWFLERRKVPLDQVTFANIFVNGNYRRFRALDLAHAALVSCAGGDFTVPEHVINTDFDLDALVEQLLAVDRPILVAAGPAACVLIHKYWQRAGARRQIIVDIGSALDEVVRGRRTRGYHHPESPTATRICRW
jgi:2-polyprenyl-3-methyl-5-hydroxy-6-metoxy-1,4-benzoquinol methylase